VEETTNPRYLDDAYYILTQCDSTAASDAIRTLAARRADIQRSLERNNPDWTAAMLLAEESLRPKKSDEKDGFRTFGMPLCNRFVRCAVDYYATSPPTETGPRTVLQSAAPEPGFAL
jgi:hypothetical protein